MGLATNLISALGSNISVNNSSSVISPSNVLSKVVTTNSSNVTSAITKVTKVVSTSPNMTYINMWIAILVAIILAVILWWQLSRKRRLDKLLKQGYGWVHFFMKSGKLKTYFIKLQDRFTIEGLGMYFGDSTADVIEWKTGARHRFFFEGSPFQIRFIPAGINFAIPESLKDPQLRALFKEKSPKVIQLKSSLTSELFDRYLKLAARYGDKIRNVTGFKISRETAIAILIIGIAIVVVIKMLFTKS